MTSFKLDTKHIGKEVIIIIGFIVLIVILYFVFRGNNDYNNCWEYIRTEYSETYDESTETYDGTCICSGYDGAQYLECNGDIYNIFEDGYIYTPE